MWGKPPVRVDDLRKSLNCARTGEAPAASPRHHTNVCGRGTVSGAAVAGINTKVAKPRKPRRGEQRKARIEDGGLRMERGRDEARIDDGREAGRRRWPSASILYPRSSILVFDSRASGPIRLRIRGGRGFVVVAGGFAHADLAGEGVAGAV